jgi:2-polyprenyl-3-methyl-5-hydroxy-6-metoxy-1,4-benzoquinol methylase
MILTEIPSQGKCKICDSSELKLFAHTSKCSQCGVLLCYPYPKGREEDYLKQKPLSEEESQDIQSSWLGWHILSGERNHNNFTEMASFALNNADRQKSLKILDYGGGGGQFSLVVMSLFPKVETHIVDMDNNALLYCYRPLNRQIFFADFDADRNKFDIIFLNDVYEHVTDPIGLLKQLKAKLNVNGIIFIDTPCQFWLYPLTKLIWKKLHIKLLNGTVDFDHQQIWSKTSFHLALSKAGLQVTKYKELSEFTQKAEFYLNSMGIQNPFLKFIGRIFVAVAPIIAKNKIMSCAKAA